MLATIFLLFTNLSLLALSCFHHRPFLTVPGRTGSYPEVSWSCSACTMFRRLASARAWVKWVYGAMKQ